MADTQHEKRGYINGKDRQKRKGLRTKLAVKVTAIIAVSIVLVAAASSLLIYNLSFQALKDEIRNNLIVLASTSVVSLDAERLKSIKSPEDEGNEAYLELQKKLQEIQKASDDSANKLRYVYTIAKNGDKYTYVIDAAPISDKENHSSVGDEFKVGEYPVAVEGFEKPTAENDPIPDEEFGGLIQTGYAPIRDGSGTVVGVLAVDMDVSVLKVKEEALRNARYIALSVALLLAVLLGVILSRYLTKPVLALTKGTKSVAEGDFDAKVDVNRNDELGQLADAFNVMAGDLKASHEALKKYNLELEEKVAQRTSELSQINKEIKDILDNMSQAIFTIDQDFRFNPQHSRYANDIFGDIAFAERNMLDVFFPYETKSVERKSLEAWLRKVFTSTDVRWENLEALQPVREAEIRVKDVSGKEKTKYIQIDFQPITDVLAPVYKEQVTKMMVIVQDITVNKLLTLEMEKKEQEYKDNINQIVEIIKADQDLFKDFVNECKESLADFEPKLIALRDDKDNMDLTNELFRIMHTIKGNARIFKLVRIEGEAHNMENIFSSIRKGETVMTEGLLDDTFKRLDRFTVLFNETLGIYEKIVNNKNLDLGKTRSDVVRWQESDVIKVKVHELNRLAELIKKADRLIVDDVSRFAAQNIGNDKVEAIESLLRETGQQLQSMRRVAVSRLFTRIPRMVRDISSELGKKVRLVMKGDEIDIDRNIFDNIGDPLIHLVRNSLDHGIETPEERVQLGKPEEGTIELRMSVEDSNLLFEIKDDGKGLDLDKIKANAVRKGLITPEKAMQISDEEAIYLVFLPGFSTNDSVTEISGRGVGLDIVKTSIEENLHGSVLLESKKNRGLKITLNIPLALEI